MKKNRIKTAVVFFFSVLCLSCKTQETERLYLDNDFYWANATPESTAADALTLEYQHLDKMGYKNLREIAGKTGNYLWLKAQFTIPPALSYEDLSLVIPYMHFAEALYLNGEFIGEYGIMEGSIHEAGYAAHLFNFPKDFLYQTEANTILIKVLCLGSATITDGVFIALRKDAQKASDNITFWASRIYVFFEGGMFTVWLFFLMIYFAFKKDKAYLHFSMLNFLTMIFFSNFFMGDLPWAGLHNGVPFIWYVKIAKCLSFFGIEFIFSLFVFDFLQEKHHIVEQIARIICAAICSAATILSPSYIALMNLTQILLVISGIDVLLSLGMTIKDLAVPQKKARARMLLLALSPLFISVIADFVIKGVLNNIKLPYFSMIGWQGSIISFFVYFSTSYNRLAVRLEYLNRNLEDEVEIQTKSLSAANDKLEREKQIARADMQTAALVQRKFFHLPENALANWDIAVRYEPLSIVSGDLFNFYYEDNTLNGISLFDASGHGVAASLITMLAEHIIQKNFEDSLEQGESVSFSLNKINKNFTEAKGDVDNFLTGLMIRTKENIGQNCDISLANAGHPCPIFYKSDTDLAEELLPDAESPATGPVGIKGFEPDYSTVDFTMKKDDILLLFTDGLTETMNASREEFGTENVRRLLSVYHKKTAEEIIQLIMEGLSSFAKDAPRTDDITIIILKRK